MENQYDTRVSQTTAQLWYWPNEIALDIYIYNNIGQFSVNIHWLTCRVGDRSYIKKKRAIRKTILTYLECSFWNWHNFHNVYAAFWCQIFLPKHGMLPLKDRHNTPFWLLASRSRRHDADTPGVLWDQSGRSIENSSVFQPMTRRDANTPISLIG